MCEPATLTAISIGFSALTTGAQYLAEKQAADSNNKFQAEQQRVGEINARNAFIFNTNQETQKNLQEDQAKSFELTRIHKERLVKQGEAVASNASVGVPIDQLLADYEMQEANYRSALNQEAQFKSQQSGANMKGFQAQYNDRTAAYNYNPIQAPSLAGAVAGFGAKATGSIMNYYGTKDKVAKKGV